MNGSLPNQEPVIDICINAIYDHGKTIEECLLQFPDQQKELEPLLRLTGRLQNARAISAPEDMKVAAAARMAALVHSQPQVKAALYPPPSLFPQAQPRTAPARRSAAEVTQRRYEGRAARVFALGLVLVFVLLVVNTTVTLARQSIPGEPLYQVKRAEEQVRLALAQSAPHQARIHLDIAARRASETQNLIRQGAANQAVPAVQDYRAELAVLQSYLASSSLSESEKQKIAAQLSAQIEQDEQDLKRMVETLIEGQAVIPPEEMKKIRQEVDGAIEDIHNAHKNMREQYPNLPVLDWQILPFYTITTSPESARLTQTPAPRIHLPTIVAPPPEMDPEDGEAEWPMKSPDLPTVRPTQWKEQWATLLPPPGTATFHVPDRTLIATYAPPVVQTILPQLPPPPSEWPSQLPDPPDLPGDLPLPGFP